jgi:CheY-like chemotaxis protein
MPFRIREILLVSSAYDAFVLEEDGSLSDRLFYEYSELSLSWAPRLTHAPTAARAHELLAKRRFDMVITVVHVSDSDAGQLSQAIKEQQRHLPVVLLIFDEEELDQFSDRKVPDSIDRVFQWTGNAGVLIAAIKTLEDARNVEHDTTVADVQVILVVEDEVRAYSSFLALLYPELMSQSGSLIAEGLNDFHRLMRMRGRPKIVLANDYEQASALFEKHRRNICALMTDIRIPRGGEEAADGGIQLAKKVRAAASDLPILFQSSERGARRHAQALGAWFVNKNAPDFHAQIRWFLKEALGFGEFVFRLPDRTEVARANDVYEMEKALQSVPEESVAYHAASNHFSVWLRARSLFELAARIKPQRISDFDDVEAMRADLINVLQAARRREQEGVITDLSSRRTGPENRFVRIGRGSIGGKGRGIAFVGTQIVRHRLLRRFKGLQIRIPKTVVLGTDAFDVFMEGIDRAELLALPDDEAITKRMLAVDLPDAVMRDLFTAWLALKGPLAVRSSSLLEDSRFRPFAGVYATYMLPNNHPDDDVRFGQLLDAIKAVYASCFWQDARNYLAGTPHESDDQSMAVVIQQVVGQAFGSRYYPAVSGVAQSYNYYPIGTQKSEDGVAHLALGLGHTVVGGGVSLRVSPGAPTVLPQFPTAESFLLGSQSVFYALDLAHATVDLTASPEASLTSCDLSAAEADGTLALVGSVYSAADDVIRENFKLPGPRVVTFNNILKWKGVPLAQALTHVLTLMRDAMGEEVEVEFAVDLPTPGGRRRRLSDVMPAVDVDEVAPASHDARGARLYVVQVRPMSSPEQRQLLINLDELDDDAFFARSDIALGHGHYDSVRDVIFVERERLDARVGRELCERLAVLNDRLRSEGRPYLLIGPGRWGSSDPTLGVPVKWSQIGGARVIVETPIGGRRIEPSQGTHFFRNITAAKVGYVTIESRSGSSLDRDWLMRQPAGAASSDSVRHVELPQPLGIHIDGRRGQAVLLKRAADLRPADVAEPDPDVAGLREK